jgi:hypothetical protein
MRITWFSPLHVFWYVLKAPEEQKHALSASVFHLGLTIYTHVSCHGFFLVECKELEDF